MLNLLHISDLHFGPPFVPEVADALLRTAHQLTPDLVVASGDFTQNAQPDEFAAARDYLAQMPRVPTVVTPGNHDVPAFPTFLFTSSFARYQQYLHPELDYVLRVDVPGKQACLASLNSTSWMGSLVNGRLSSEQLAKCERWFAEAPADAIRVVVAHHHFAPAPDLEGGSVMRQARRAIDQFIRLKVELILGGHLHRSYIGNSLDFYPGANRQRGIIIVQCGTSTSGRGRVREHEKNSFNFIQVDAQLVRITHYLYFSDLKGFAPASEHFFPRADRQHLAFDAKTRSIDVLHQTAEAEQNSQSAG